MARVLASLFVGARRRLARKGESIATGLGLAASLMSGSAGQTGSAPSLSAGPEAALVQVAREFVASVDASDRERITRSISFARWYEAGVAGDDVDRGAYVSLRERERRAWREDLLASLLEGRLRAQLAGRIPADGGVESAGPSEALVWLHLRAQEGGGEERGVFRLGLEGKRWRVYGVGGLTERSPKGATSVAVETVLLSDGSLVFEGRIEPKGHLTDTPPAVRARIDSLVAVLLDPGKTKEVSRARRELAQIGKPAIPRLLNALATTPMGIEENDVLLHIVNKTLTDITGHYTTFAPMVGERSLFAASDELRRSGLKQWFAWWEMNRRTFGVPGADSRPASRPS